MKVKLERVNNEYLFEGKTTAGASVMIDNTSAEEVKGASPMELLLMGVGGCSAIDVVHILKKQRQNITSYKMEVRGEREQVKDAKPFNAIHVDIHLEGDIEDKKAIKAAELSFDKYCSVSITMEKGVDIDYSIFLNGNKIK
jgi:putative redox protein